MRYSPVNLGFDIADAEDVRVQFYRGSLRLDFVDWREQAIQLSFEDVIGFHWDDELQINDIRDDQAYEVHDSEWLSQQVGLAVVTERNSYAHYKLCFNAVGILDVLCKRLDDSK